MLTHIHQILNGKEYLKVRNEIYKYIIEEFTKKGIDITLIFIAMLDTPANTVGTDNIIKLIGQKNRSYKKSTKTHNLEISPNMFLIFFLQKV